MPGGPTAPDRLHDAVAQLRSEGLKVRGRVGDSDPLVAVGETIMAALVVMFMRRRLSRPRAAIS